MKLKLAVGAFVALAAIASSAHVAIAGTAPDQTDPNQPGNVLVGSIFGDAAQTFVPSLTGALTGVDIPVALLSGSGRLEVVVESTTGSSATPADNVLATATAPASAFGPPAFPLPTHHFDFASPPQLVRGRTYALVVSAGSSSAYILGTDTGNGYRRGTGWESPGGGPWLQSASSDLTFTTWMTTGPLASPTHESFCAVAGDLWPDGSAIAPGTFLNLEIDQPSWDAHYAGAVPANYVEGKGLTCDPPPSGATLDGTYDGPGASSGLYPYYRTA
jgi:hypothetical protein